MNKIIRLIAAELAFHLTNEKIDNAFAQLRSSPPPPKNNKYYVGALQVTAQIYPSLHAMICDIDRYMLAATRKGVGLICFPELYGLFTAFASPIIQTAFRALCSVPTFTANESASEFRLQQLYEPFSFLSERYLYIMSRFAKRYKAWISCGSIYTYERREIFNRHTLLDSNGCVVGKQDKLHLVPHEIKLGISSGKELCVVSTPFGKIALTVCMDATYFETFKIAKGLSADFALVPIANMEPYNRYLALRGAAMRVSETGLAAVKSALVSGKNFPVEFTGMAGIYYPLGFLQKSKETGQISAPAVLVSQINIDALRAHTSSVFCLQNKAFNESLFK